MLEVFWMDIDPAPDIFIFRLWIRNPFLIFCINYGKTQSKKSKRMRRTMECKPTCQYRLVLSQDEVTNGKVSKANPPYIVCNKHFMVYRRCILPWEIRNQPSVKSVAKRSPKGVKGCGIFVRIVSDSMRIPIIIAIIIWNIRIPHFGMPRMPGNGRYGRAKRRVPNHENWTILSWI